MRRHVSALFAITALGSLFAFAGPAAAAECPNEAIRIAQGATRLPNCRAYERVSPAVSTGGVIGVDSKNSPMFAAIRADGNAITFGSSSGVGDSERGALRTFNLAHRSSGGWDSFGVWSTSEPSVPSDLSNSPAWPTPSSDMSRMMFRTSRSLGPPNPITAGGSVYLSAPGGKGAPTWLSQWTFEGTQPSGTGMPLGGSPDLSSGYFSYSTPLTSLAGDNLRTSSSGLYFFEGSTILPAGVLPSGAVSPEGAVPAGTGGTTGTSGSATVLPELARNQVSADGSKLFFVSPNPDGGEPPQLYVQEGAAPGRLVSHDALGNAAATGLTTLDGSDPLYLRRDFAYATPDGSRVVFRSESALTGDAPAEGVKTYRAEITPSAIELTYLPAVDGAVLEIDEDASTILFATPGSVSGRSFYVWDEDRPATPYEVTTDLEDAGLAVFEPVFSGDGDVLFFGSAAEVEPGIAAVSGADYTQIYRWTKQAGTPVCISCRRDGGAPAPLGSRMSNLHGLRTDNPAYSSGSSRPDYFNQSTVVGNRQISSDGSRVFFDTNDPLDPARDVNGTRDVYMWEDGKTYLLTSGRNPVPSLVYDNSSSGDDVMFVTKDGLIPSDTNQTYDVYDVRVDGGFAEPRVEGCEGDACQGPSSGSRQAAVPASNLLAGAGNQREARKGKPRPRKALATTQLGRPGPTSARVRIQVPSAGKVSIVGSDIKTKERQVNGGAVVIAVGLSEVGKQKLADKGQLKATVRVTFRPSSGAPTRKSMTLSFATPKGAR